MLFNLFWIHRFDQLSSKYQTNEYRMLKGVAWMAMLVYIVGIPQALYQMIIQPKPILGVSFLLQVILFPLGYRLVVSVVARINRLRID